MKIKKKRLGNRSQAVEIANLVNSTLKKSVLKLASDSDFLPIKIPSGSLVVDRISGGGFSLGRHVELYGDESACKSYIAYRTMALSQERGNVCALIDPEGIFDQQWFRHLGGVPEELLYERPEDAEEAIEVLRTFGILAKDGAPIEVVTIDSIAALVTKEQVEKDPREDERIASQARMMSRALRVITSQNRRILFLWTNQERMNIGFGAQFNPRTTPGGRAMKYYATSRIEFKRAGKVTAPKEVADKGQLKKKSVVVGNWIQVRSEKEKSARPHMQQMFIFDTKRGEIDLASEIVQLGLEDGYIERHGNTFVYEDLDGNEWKGTESQFKKILMATDEVRQELVSAISDKTIEMGLV